MNQRFKKHLAKYKLARIVCLEIPDNYAYMQPELVALLKARMSRFLTTIT